MREVFGSPREWGRGRLPVIEAYAALPHNAFYSSRALVAELMKQLNIPDLQWLSSDRRSSRRNLNVELGIDAPAAWYSLLPKYMREDQYWEAMMRTADVRRCDTFSIEFATALLVNRRNKLPADHIQHLASLSEGWQKRFVLTGVARLTELWDVFHDLRRRVLPVWFYPYNEQLRRGDRGRFMQLLKSSLRYYDFVREDDVRAIADDIMAATAGIYGEVIKLYMRARVVAAGEGQQVVEKIHLQKAFYDQSSLKTLWRGVDEFELAAKAGDPSVFSLHRPDERVRSELVK